MTKCTESGCRSLEWKCADCGRVASTASKGWIYSDNFSKTEYFQRKIKNVNEWISVEDRLPPFGQPVLVWDTCGSAKTKGSVKQVTRNVNSQKNFWYYDWGGFIGNPRYSHWMPLPQPPKEKS